MTKLKCPRCTMTFQIRWPTKSGLGTTTCAERGCNVVFWHHEHPTNRTARVGITPYDLSSADGLIFIKDETDAGKS